MKNQFHNAQVVPKTTTFRSMTAIIAKDKLHWHTATHTTEMTTIVSPGTIFYRTYYSMTKTIHAV